MKRIFLLGLILVLALSTAAIADQPTKTMVEMKDMPGFLGFVPDEIVVNFDQFTTANMSKSANVNGRVGIYEIDRLADRLSVVSIRPQFPGAADKARSVDLSGWHMIKFAADVDVEKAVEEYKQLANVLDAQPIGLHAIYAMPNDYLFGDQWHMNQASDHDIDAPEAWDIETGNDNIIVAILDSGVRYFHKDLGGANASYSNPGASRGNMWINWAEKNGSAGYDDDGNGYVDDWIGWDFIDGVSNCWSGEDCNTQDNDPRDFFGHGTHCAGIVAAGTNDAYGTAGVAGGWYNGSLQETGNGVKIMALRMGYSYNYFGQEYGVVDMAAAASAFYYAANNGAHIASCSWGNSNTGGLGAAVSYFLSSGGMVFVAAGNSGSTSADYLNARGDCISVAATTETDNGASFTNYGTWVDICAPGNNILSSYHDHGDPANDYVAEMSGTSMSCPMAAAVAALIWSQNPGWSASQVENQLYSSAENIDAYLSSKYIGKMGAGRINAYDAVNPGIPPPVANFSGSPTSGCAPLTVNFTDLSTGEITSWSWNFGDGGSSTAQNPSHQYTSGGTRTVSLTVTGPGGSDGETKTNYITVNVGPTAAFYGTPTAGTEPLTVSFHDQSTGATSWSWNFGDGGTSTAQNPTHEYSAGTYTVSLTVTNACGNDTETKTNYITVDPCVAPVANFTGTPTSGEAPLTVNFTDQSSGNPTSWSWTFGDGGTSTAQNPSHEYTSAGTYTVSLTATNSCGSDGETKTGYITVTCTPPVANFVGAPTSGDAPLTVNFTDLSTGATSWDWNFGDGGTSTSQNPTYQYTSVGLYTVTLTVTNSCGSDAEQKVGYINVTQPSIAYAIPPYSTGFELGSFDQYWFTQSSNSEGRILITTANSPHSGSYHLTMDDNTNGGQYAQNEAWLRLNLAGKTDVDLFFWWKEFGDENHDQDGVYFSANGGSSFTKVYSLTGGNTTYREIALDVDQLAASAGLSLTSTFVVKFQQYDNYSITTDGMAFDDISVVSYDVPPVADFSGDPTSGVAPLTVDFTDLSTGNPTSWSWTFGDGGTSTQQNPSYTYYNPGTYTVSLTATNAYGNDTETKTGYITVTEPGDWVVITYDDFEGGMGNYTDGGADMMLYTGGTYAYQGSRAADIQDNSGTASSFYHTIGHDVTGFAELEVEFYFIAISMDNTNEDFWVQYYDGATWQTVAALAYNIDFVNGVFYNVIVTIPSSYYNFPTNARLRFMCDASGNSDDVYIDAIEFRGMGGTSSVTALPKSNPLIPDQFALAQNYPNPFNPTTTISYSLPVGCHVNITVYNVLGREVKTLVNEWQDAGVHQTVFNADGMASGVYFYRITTDQYIESKKMLLLK